MPIRPGLVSISFRSLSVMEILHLVATSGLEGIEWGGDIHVPHGQIATAREVGQATKDAGLEVAAYGSYYRAGESEDQGLSFEAVCESAAALGAPTIRIWAGSQNSEDASPAYRQKVTEDIIRVAAIAAGAKMTVSLEFHGKTLTNTTASTLELLEATSADQVKTLWQPPVGMNSVVAREGLRMVLPRLGNVHVFHWWPDHLTRLPLAAGREEWEEHFRVVESEGHSRWALLEFVRNDDPEQFRRDAQTLRELLGASICQGGR